MAISSLIVPKRRIIIVAKETNLKPKMFL